MGLNEFRKRTRLYKEVLAMPELELDFVNSMGILCKSTERNNFVISDIQAEIFGAKTKR